MQDVYLHAAWSCFIILLLLLNTFAYCIKALLWTRGLPASLIWHHHDDRNFNKLIPAESDPDVRRKYVALRRAFRVCCLLLFVIPLTLVAVSYAVRYFKSP
jgi:hypothetical protein